MHIMFNFVPNELVTCDNWDPPWMNRYIKNVIVTIIDFHEKFVKQIRTIYLSLKIYQNS